MCLNLCKCLILGDRCAIISLMGATHCGNTEEPSPHLNTLWSVFCYRKTQPGWQNHLMFLRVLYWMLKSVECGKMRT